MAYLGRSKGSARRVVFCGLPDFIAMTPVRLLSQMLAFFLKLNCQGTPPSLKRKRKFFFVRSLPPVVLQRRQKMYTLRRGDKKAERRGKNRKKPGGEGEFSFLPIPFSFCPSLPLPFRGLNLPCLSILQLLERP